MSSRAILTILIAMLGVVSLLPSIFLVLEEPYYAFGHDFSLIGYLAGLLCLAMVSVSIFFDFVTRWKRTDLGQQQAVTFGWVAIFYILAFLNIMAYVNSTGNEDNSWSLPSSPSEVELLFALTYISIASVAIVSVFFHSKARLIQWIPLVMTVGSFIYILLISPDLINFYAAAVLTVCAIICKDMSRSIKGSL